MNLDDKFIFNPFETEDCGETVPFGINDVLGFNFTVLGLTETWFTEHNKDLYNIKGYSIENRIRQNKLGGGVSLLIQSNIEYTCRDDVNDLYVEPEMLFIEIDKKYTTFSRDVIIGVVYRAPNTDVTETITSLQNILTKINDERKICYIMGDFYIDLLNVDACHTGEFLDLMYSYSYVPLTIRPTRITSSITNFN